MRVRVHVSVHVRVRERVGERVRVLSPHPLEHWLRFACACARMREFFLLLWEQESTLSALEL